MAWQRTDDLGGVGDASPTTFGVDGRVFVLDLNEENAEQLRSLLAPFVAVALPIGELPEPVIGELGEMTAPVESKSVQRRRAVMAKTTAALPPDRAAKRRASRSASAVAERDQVRKWAQGQGLQVAERGRISAEIMAAFRQANEQSV